MKLINSLGGWRQVLLRAMGWLHCGLIYALYFAAVVRFVQGEEALLGAFFRGLLSVIPFALADLGSQYIRKLWKFLLASVVICGVAWPLLGHPAAMIPVAVVCFFRARNGLSEEPVDSVLDRPVAPLVLVGIVPFVYSAVSGGALLQKLCWVWAAVYLLLWCAYRGLINLEGYLALNRGMSGLPVKRIVRTCGLAVAGMVVFAGALLLPALVTAEGYFHWDPNAERVEVQQPVEADPVGGMAMGPPEWLDSMGEQSNFHIPVFITYLFTAVICVGLALALLYGVYWVIRGLRGSFVDHRDVVQYLRGPEDQAEEAPRERVKRPAVWDRSPNAQVRRKYRRTVLRAAKEAPPKWAAPQEIEAGVGLQDDQLHQLYERARYSRDGVTLQESRSLKR